jgi:hypothetical protein
MSLSAFFLAVTLAITTGAVPMSDRAAYRHHYTTAFRTLLSKGSITCQEAHRLARDAAVLASDCEDQMFAGEEQTAEQLRGDVVALEAKCADLERQLKGTGEILDDVRTERGAQEVELREVECAYEAMRARLWPNEAPVMDEIDGVGGLLRHVETELAVRLARLDTAQAQIRELTLERDAAIASARELRVVLDRDTERYELRLDEAAGVQRELRRQVEALMPEGLSGEYVSIIGEMLRGAGIEPREQAAANHLHVLHLLEQLGTALQAQELEREDESAKAALKSAEANATAAFLAFDRTLTKANPDATYTDDDVSPVLV